MKEVCSRCKSHEAVKRSNKTAGTGSEHEFLCRPCRFDVTLTRRNENKAHRYTVTFGAKGKSLKIGERTVIAFTAGEAIKHVMAIESWRKENLEWQDAYCLKLVRRNV